MSLLLLAASGSPPGTIAFGSCRKQTRPQPVWEAVTRLKPDAWIWTGDYLYSQTKAPATADELKWYHAAARSSEGERRLRASVPLIDGVYDDHDYGENDGGRHYLHKEASRQLFLDEVVGAPLDSPRRYNRGGMYGSRTLGEPPRQVKLVFLDTRFSRDDHVLPSPGAKKWLIKPGYVAAALRVACAALGLAPRPSSKLLGEDQWEWLRAELSNSTASAHLIVSSIQVLTSSPLVESWGHFPLERRRLLDLLAETAPAGALLISGDVHYAELIGLGAADSADPADPAAASLLEVTSSGLTHACGHAMVGRLMCGTVLRLFRQHRISRAASFMGINFGSIGLEWEGGGGDGRLDVRVHDVNGAVVLRHELRLGIGAEAEAARWTNAIARLPTVYDGARWVRLPLAVGGLAALACMIACLGFVRGLCRPRTRSRRSTRRARLLARPHVD